MNTQYMIRSLSRFGRMLPEVVADVSPEDARWKPADGAWTILEIMCHLADEEEFDFPQRVRLTLENPDQAWPPIDPEGWAIQRQYNDGRLQDAVDRFVSLRRQSLAWLASLDNPDWSLTHQHPTFGPFRAGDVFAAWVAHDALHLRQLAKRFYQITARDAGDFSVRYAGEWRA